MPFGFATYMALILLEAIVAMAKINFQNSMKWPILAINVTGKS
jgi:hypothetical protein